MLLLARRINTLKSLNRLVPATSVQVTETLRHSFSTEQSEGKCNRNPLISNASSLRQLIDASPLPFTSTSTLSFFRGKTTGPLNRQRQSDLRSVTDILQIEDMLRHEGDQLNAQTIVLMLQATCRLIEARAKELGLPSHPAGLLARFDEPERSRYDNLISQICDAIQTRVKWFDPTQASMALSYLSNWLGRVDQRPLIESLALAFIRRLSEAQSRDLHFTLNAILEGPLASELIAFRAPMTKAAAAYLVAKLPTGRIPPENVARTLRLCVLGGVSSDLHELVAAVIKDMGVRLEIYSPTALTWVLVSLSKTLPTASPLCRAPRRQFLPEGVSVIPEENPLSVDEPLIDACVVHMARVAAQHANELELMNFLAAASKLASHPKEVPDMAPSYDVSEWAKRPTVAAALQEILRALDHKLSVGSGSNWRDGSRGARGSSSSSRGGEEARNNSNNNEISNSSSSTSRSVDNGSNAESEERKESIRDAIAGSPNHGGGGRKRDWTTFQCYTMVVKLVYAFERMKIQPTSNIAKTINEAIGGVAAGQKRMDSASAERFKVALTNIGMPIPQALLGLASEARKAQA